MVSKNPKIMIPAKFQSKKKLDPGIAAFIDKYRRQVEADYVLPPEARLRADTFFAEMEQVGRQCDSRKQFEERFFHQTMSRDLNKMLLEFIAYYRMPKEMADTLFPIHAAAPPAEKSGSAKPRRRGRLRQWIRKLVKFQTH